MAIVEELENEADLVPSHPRQRIVGQAVERFAVNTDTARRWAVEPTGNLDSTTAEEILGLMRDLHGRFGSTVVIVTHDMKVAESCDRTVVLRDGRVVEDVRRRHHSADPVGAHADR